MTLHPSVPIPIQFLKSIFRSFKKSSREDAIASAVSPCRSIKPRMVVIIRLKRQLKYLIIIHNCFVELMSVLSSIISEKETLLMSLTRSSVKHGAITLHIKALHFVLWSLISWLCNAAVISRKWSIVEIAQWQAKKHAYFNSCSLVFALWTVWDTPIDIGFTDICKTYGWT